MKRRTVVIAALLLLVAMTAWARGADEKVVAGVVFQEDQFMRLVTMGYEDAAKQAGFRILLSNTNNDQAREAELINTYVAQNVAGLAIAPLDPITSVAVLERASATMKIALADSPNANAPFIVGGFASDPYNLGATVGAEAAQFIRDKLGGKAKIALVQYKSLFVDASTNRVNGFLDAVRKVNPDVEVVMDQDAWMQDRAIQVAGDILTARSDIDIIYGANDGGTIGSVMAVKNAGLAGKCFVFGIDTGDQQLAMLRDPDNILQAVAGQDPYTIGTRAMQTVIDAINGRDYSATRGKITVVPGQLVSRSNPSGIDAFERDLREKIGR